MVLTVYCLGLAADAADPGIWIVDVCLDFGFGEVWERFARVLGAVWKGFEFLNGVLDCSKAVRECCWRSLEVFAKALEGFDEVLVRLVIGLD